MKAIAILIRRSVLLAIPTAITLWVVLELALTVLFHTTAYAKFGSDFTLYRQSAMGMWEDSSPGACLRGPHGRVESKHGRYHWSFNSMSWVADRA